MESLLPLIVAGSIALALMCLFVGFARLAKPTGALEDRLEQALRSEMRMMKGPGGGPFTRLMNGIRLEDRIGGTLALELAQADVSMTVTEYTIVRAASAVGMGLFAIIFLRSPLFALPLAILGLQLPVLWLNRRRQQRIRRFQEQLIDVLAMLVSGLQAGVGLTQAMDLVRLEMPAPAGEEFGRVVREIGLGVPLPDALQHLTERMPGDDLSMVVTVIKIQSEVGGNLAQVLDSAIGTIRERVRLFQEIRTLTASQRYTGYLLAALPFLVGGAVMMMNPDYMSPLLSLRWIWLPLTALGMMFVGFMIIRKIADIKV